MKVTKPASTMPKDLKPLTLAEQTGVKGGKKDFSCEEKRHHWHR